MPKTHAVYWNTTRRNVSRTLYAIALAACWMLFGVNTAFANDVARVTIVDQGSIELARKLRAEAAYAGFEATLEPGTPQLNDTSRHSAVVFYVASPDRVELEFARPDGGAGESQVLTVGPAEGDAFALRVVELVRARLVDLGWQVPKPPVEAEPQAQPNMIAPKGEAATPLIHRSRTNELTPPEATNLVRLWLGGGVAGALAAGGFGAMPVAAANLRVDVNDRWGVSLNGFLPLAAAEVERAEGSGRLLWHGASAGAHLLLPLPAPWFTSVGLGAGVLRLDVSGHPSDGFTGRKNRIYTGSGHVELSFGRNLVEWLRLRIHGFAGLAAPRAVLRFDDREVASVGRLFGSLGLSLEGGFDLSSEQ